MKIGIASHANISSFLPYFEDKNSIDILKSGASTYSAPAVETLIISLINEGHKVYLFVLTNHDFILESSCINIYGIKSYNVYPWKYLWGDFINAKYIRNIIKINQKNIDILHAHWTYYYAFAASSFTNNLPVFCTVRDWTPYIWKYESLKNKITWSFRVLMNEMVFRNKKINFISNSFYTAFLIKKKYNIDTPIIQNPIKKHFLTNGEREEPKNLELLCISSSNDRRKNIIILLLSFKKIIKLYPSAHLLLIGPPFVEKNRQIRKWKNRGLLRQVTLIGQINHDSLIGYIDKAKIFVTPSLEETFGNTLLESIARKVPVIAGKESGAIPYVLHHGRAGFLCDVSNVDKLTETILYVYTHKVEVATIVNNAFRLISIENDATKICNQHLNIYKGILKFN